MFFSVILNLRFLKKPILETTLVDLAMAMAMAMAMAIVNLAMVLMVQTWEAANHPWQMATYHPLLTSGIHLGLLLACLWV